MARYTLRTKDEDGNPQIREYWCPDGFGYVREERGANHGTLGQQVGEDLSYSGSMMMADASTLKSKIKQARRVERRELRRMMEQW